MVNYPKPVVGQKVFLVVPRLSGNGNRFYMTKVEAVGRKYFTLVGRSGTKYLIESWIEKSEFNYKERAYPAREDYEKLALSKEIQEAVFKVVQGRGIRDISPENLRKIAELMDVDVTELEGRLKATIDERLEDSSS